MSQLAGRWPWSTGDRVDNTWPVAALTAGGEARYRLRIAICAYSTRINALVKWVRVGILPCRLVRNNWNGVATRQWKMLKICLFVLTWTTNVMDRHTDTAWRLWPRLHSIVRQKIGLLHSTTSSDTIYSLWSRLRSYSRRSAVHRMYCSLSSLTAWLRSAGRRRQFLECFCGQNDCQSDHRRIVKQKRCIRLWNETAR